MKRKRNNKVKWMVLFIGLSLFLALDAYAGSVPKISNAAKKMAIDTIVEYDGVREAAISQNNEKINLAIIADFRVSKDYAKRIGENFLRLVKTYSKDKAPGKTIGEGIYNYMVGVYNPNEEVLVMGTKIENGSSISW